jgi:GAF domain-containing protein
MAQFNSPASDSDIQYSFKRWQESFLRSILNATAAFGIVAVAAALLTQTDPIYKIAYVGTYLLLVLVTFARLAYRVKAGFFLFLIYAIGVSGLLVTGIWGDVRVFFLALIVMTGLLFSPAAVRIAAVVSLITIGLAGALILTGQYHITSQDVAPGDLATWLTGIASLIALSFIIIWSLQLFQEEFARAQQDSEQSVQALKSERAQLEDRVFIRTQELEARTRGLRTTAQIARQIADIQDVPTLLAEIVQLASDQLGFYHVAIYLLDDEGKTAFLQAASSETGQQMLERGHRVQTGERNAIAYVIENRKPYRLLGIATSKSSMPHPDFPLTRSEMALPLTVRGKTIGVIDFHSDKAQDFSDEDADMLETMADQLSASIDNVRLLNETQGIVTQLEVLTSEETRATWQGFLGRRASAYQYSPAGIKAIPGSKAGTKRGLEIPLRLRGQEIGRISLQRKEQGGTWGERERDLVEKVATQVVLALDNSRLIEESRRRAQQEQTVGEISARLSRSLDIDTLLQTAARELGALPEVSEVAIILGEGSHPANPPRSAPTPRKA